MNEKQPSIKSPEISQEELEGLFMAIAEALVLRGDLEVNEAGAALKKPGDKTPYVFEAQLPDDVSKDIFFADEDMAPVSVRVTYRESHRIDNKAGFDDMIRSVSIDTQGRGVDGLQLVNRTMSIYQDGRLGPDYLASVNTEVTDLDGDELIDFDEESVDYISVGDAGELRKVIEFINSRRT